MKKLSNHHLSEGGTTCSMHGSLVIQKELCNAYRLTSFNTTEESLENALLLILNKNLNTIDSSLTLRVTDHRNNN